MSKKRSYQVTLTPELVDEGLSLSLGSKLSPILNSLLELWIRDKENIENLIKKIGDKNDLRKKKE